MKKETKRGEEEFSSGSCRVAAVGMLVSFPELWTALLGRTSHSAGPKQLMSCLLTLSLPPFLHHPLQIWHKWKQLINVRCSFWLHWKWGAINQNVISTKHDDVWDWLILQWADATSLGVKLLYFTIKHKVACATLWQRRLVKWRHYC